MSVHPVDSVPNNKLQHGQAPAPVLPEPAVYDHNLIPPPNNNPNQIPPPNNNPSQIQPQNNVTQQQTTVTVQVESEPSPSGSPDPVKTKCPSCNAEITTVTKYVAGSNTWSFCILLLFSIIGAPFCWIPFVIGLCKDVNHECPNCNADCGRYKRPEYKFGKVRRRFGRRRFRHHHHGRHHRTRRFGRRRR